jgi:hypothetical protein
LFRGVVGKGLGELTLFIVVTHLAWRIDGVLGGRTRRFSCDNIDFFSVCRLESGSVLTFGQIDLGIVMSWVCIELSVKMLVMVRSLNVDMCR